MDERDRRGSPVPAADPDRGGVEDPATVHMRVGDLAPEPPPVYESHRGRGRWWRLVAVTAVVAVGAVVASIVTTGGGVAGPRLPSAPTSPVAPRWSVAVDGAPAIVSATPGRATVEPTLEIVDGVVLHTLRSRVGRVTAVVQRSARTGEVAWWRDAPKGTQPVVVGSRGVVAGPSGRWLTARNGALGLEGLSLSDGAVLWDEPIGEDFVGWVDPAGALFVSGNARCGYLDPPTGQPLFVQVAPVCVPAGQGLARDSADGWAVVDPHGQPLAVVDGGRVAPRVVGQHVAWTRGDELHVLDPAGEETVVPAPHLDRLADTAVDADHVSAWAGVDQFVVDLETPRLLGPFAPAALPVVVDGELLVVDDGSFPVPELVASGTWSRSPDANDVRVLDARGGVVATRRMVLAPPMLATAEGVLLWEQVGTDCTLGLYRYDDLEPIWEVAFRGSPLPGMASSDGLVVASYLDREGDVRLVGLGPS